MNMIPQIVTQMAIDADQEARREVYRVPSKGEKNATQPARQPGQGKLRWLMLSLLHLR